MEIYVYFGLLTETLVVVVSEQNIALCFSGLLELNFVTAARP